MSYKCLSLCPRKHEYSVNIVAQCKEYSKINMIAYYEKDFGNSAESLIMSIPNSLKTADLHVPTHHCGH